MIPVGDPARHAANLAVITKYSPFGSTQVILDQFSRIASEHGNLVVCYNLWTVVEDEDEKESDMPVKDPTYDGDIPDRTPANLEEEPSPPPPTPPPPPPATKVLELGLWDAQGDLRLHTSTDLDTGPKKSLRAYLARLYLHPLIRIAIQGVWLHPMHPYGELAFCRKYKVPLSCLMSRETHLQQVNLIRQRQDTVRARWETVMARTAVLEKRWNEQHNSSALMRKKMTQMPLPQALTDNRATATHLQSVLQQIETDLTNMEKRYAEGKLTMVFGLNTKERSNTGLMIYHCGRLIRLYDRHHTGIQARHPDPAALGAAGGVVGKLSRKLM